MKGRLGTTDAVMILLGTVAVLGLLFQFAGWWGIGFAVAAFFAWVGLKAAWESEPELMGGALGCLALAGVIIGAGALFAFGMGLVR
jgi:hypothetical protein